MRLRQCLSCTNHPLTQALAPAHHVSQQQAAHRDLLIHSRPRLEGLQHTGLQLRRSSEPGTNKPGATDRQHLSQLRVHAWRSQTTTSSHRTLLFTSHHSSNHICLQLQELGPAAVHVQSHIRYTCLLLVQRCMSRATHKAHMKHMQTSAPHQLAARATVYV
jgi:hypothetical protein